MDDNEKRVFEDLVSRFHHHSVLAAAFRESEQHFANALPQGGYPMHEVVRHAWDTLDPSQKAQEMNHLFNSWFLSQMGIRRWLELEAKGPRGDSYLHHDDLEVLEHVAEGIEDGLVYVEFDLLQRLVSEIGLLQHRLTMRDQPPQATPAEATAVPAATDTLLPEVFYTGTRSAQTGGPSAVHVVDAEGNPLGLVAHRAKHSPSGMTWGDGGSGAADCARSILAHAVGDRVALCPYCHAVRANCTICGAMNGVILPKNICQRFKFDVVAKWGDTFKISRSEILEWLRSHFPDAAHWPQVG